MAGYIMTLDNEHSLTQCVLTGTYSTNLSEPRRTWMTHHEGTFADYFSMKPGDSIYFFIKRKIYGVGRIIHVNQDCKYLNYLEADLPIAFTYDEYRDREPLLPYGTQNNRCFCTFEPSPFFFRMGVDMDDALSSNPDKFRMLRAMWKVSFIKIDEEENQALLDIILKRNEQNLLEETQIFDFSPATHEQISKDIRPGHRLTPSRLLASCAKGYNIKHEMAMEAALCDILVRENDTPFGAWDYVSHQVVASPFKAIDYMDKMDIFGYRYIAGYKTISKYLVIEIKKDSAEIDVINQVMKYVDWINQEYAHGDYSMIQAYVVAAGFSKAVIEKRDNEAVRNYTKGYRPTKPCRWNYVKLIQYKYIGNEMQFIEI